MPSVRIQPGHGGMNSESSPDYVGPSQAVSLENLLPRPGKVVLRGPISDGIDLGTSNYQYIDGAIVFGSDIWMRSDHDSRYVNDETVDPSATDSPGKRFCALGDFGYVIPQPGGSSIYQWDGATTVVGLTNGPIDVHDITTHLGRLFTIDRDNVLKWSDLGGPLTNLASYWQDDVSGLTNQLTVGDSNDKARGLGHCGKQLAIIKDRSVYMLTGLTPSSFAVQRLTNETGCISRETIVDADDGCYFLSEHGFVYVDGSSVVDVSEDIKGELLTAIRDTGFPFDDTTNRYWSSGVGTSLPFARAANIGRNCIMLTLGVENTSDTVVPTINLCAIYDTRQRTWTKFSSDAFVLGAPVYFLPTPASSFYAGATLGYDGVGTLFYLDDLAAPESAAATLAGEDTVDGITEGIAAEFHSRIVPLSSPTKTSQLKRLLFDYSFVVVADGAPFVNCWSISLVDGQGNVLLAPTAVQATILASGYTADQRRAALVRKRFSVECYAEASEVQLRVTLPDLFAVTEVIAAEVHDATIEYETGRDRPTA